MQSNAILTTKDEIDAYSHVVADLYRNSLYHLCKFGLGYREINRRTHGGIIRSLESPSLRKLLVMPRGTFKSSIGVVGYSIQTLLKDPNKRILIDSENYQNSRNFIREIRGKLEQTSMTDLYGEFRSDDNWAEGSITIKQRNKVFKESSVTASGVGANKTGQHYDVIIHDDLNTDKNSNTPELCRKVIDHYKMNTSILEPNGIMVVIGTRYSELDVIEFILQNEVNYEGLLSSHSSRV